MFRHSQADACFECGQQPILGTRWRCGSCPGPIVHSFCTDCLLKLSTGGSISSSQLCRHAVAAAVTVGCVRGNGGCSVVAAGLAVQNTPAYPPESLRHCTRCEAKVIDWVELDADGAPDRPTRGVCGDCIGSVRATGIHDAAIWVRQGREMVTHSQPAETSGVKPKVELMPTRQLKPLLCGVCREPITSQPRWECIECMFDACGSCVTAGRLGEHPDSHELVVSRPLLVVSPPALSLASLSSSRAPAASKLALTTAPTALTGAAATAAGPARSTSDGDMDVARSDPVVKATAAPAAASAAAAFAQLMSLVPPNLSRMDVDGDDPGLVEALTTHVSELLGVTPLLDPQPDDPSDAHTVLFSLHRQVRANHPLQSVAIDVANECLCALMHAGQPDDTQSTLLEELGTVLRSVRLPPGVHAPRWLMDCEKEGCLDRTAVRFVLEQTYSRRHEVRLGPRTADDVEQPVDAVATPRGETVDSRSDTLTGPPTAPVTLVESSVEGCTVCLVPLPEMDRVLRHRLPPPEFHACRIESLPIEQRHDQVMVFLSHRWLKKAHPDENGTDWGLAHAVLMQLCRAVVAGVETLLELLGFRPEDVHAELVRQTVTEEAGFGYIRPLNHAEAGVALTECAGRPHVNGRLTHDLVRVALAQWEPELDVATRTRRLSERVCVWYDYTCLPQEQRTPAEAELMASTLRHLSKIQRAMHTIVVNTDREYLTRAWCVAEVTNAGDAYSLGTDPEDYSDDEGGSDDGWQRPDSATVDVFGHTDTQHFDGLILRAMLNPLVTTPEDVLEAVGLRITYAGKDAPDVCRTLWATVVRAFASPFNLQLFGPGSGILPRGYADFGARTRLGVHERHDHTLLLAAGLGVATVSASLHRLHSLLPKGDGWSFDQWLACRRDSRREMDAVLQSDPSAVLRLYIIPEDTASSRVDEALHVKERNLRTLCNVVDRVGLGLMRRLGTDALAVYACHAADSVDWSAPNTVVVAPTTVDAPLLRHVATVRVPALHDPLPTASYGIGQGRAGTPAARFFAVRVAAAAQARSLAEYNRRLSLRSTAVLSHGEAALLDDH